MRNNGKNCELGIPISSGNRECLQEFLDEYVLLTIKGECMAFYMLLSDLGYKKIRIYSATKTRRHKEKTDINKEIHMWPDSLNNINTPHIKQAHQCNN